MYYFYFQAFIPQWVAAPFPLWLFKKQQGPGPPGSSHSSSPPAPKDLSKKFPLGLHDCIRSHIQFFVLYFSKHSGGEIIAKLIAMGTTCVYSPSPIQGWTPLGPTSTTGPTQNLDRKAMVVS